MIGLLDKMPQLEEEKLIEHLSRFTKKRNDPLSSSRKKSTGTHVTSVQENKTPEPSKKTDFKEGILSREVKELRSQVAELREVVTNFSKAAVSRSRKHKQDNVVCVENNQPGCDHVGSVEEVTILLKAVVIEQDRIVQLNQIRKTIDM